MTYMFGKTLNLLNEKGEPVRCPYAPIYIVKVMGTVLDIDRDRAHAEGTYTSSNSLFKEIWKLDTKGTHLVKASRGFNDRSSNSKAS